MIWAVLAEQLPSGRHGLPREFVIRNQQMRIIDAMAKVVVAKSYPAMSVADILAEAGVSRRTFYEHYRSKHDCFVRSIDVVVTGMLRRVEEAYEGDAPWSERFRAALETLLDIMYREPGFARMCLVESLSAGPDAFEIYGRMLDRFEHFFEDAAELAPDSSVLPDNIARSIVSGICGVVFRHLVEGRGDELPGLLPDLVYFAEVPFIGPERAARSAAAAAKQAPAISR